MFEIFALILFVWFFVGAIRLTFKVTWGLAKIAAMILFVLALPAFIAILLLTGGFLLLVPLVLVGAGCGILKACL